MQPSAIDQHTSKRLSPRLLALLGAYTLIVSHGIGRFLYTANLPAMLEQTFLTTVMSGYVASANYAGYLAGAIVAMLVPRIKTVRSVQLGIIMSIIATFMMLVEHLPTWYVSRFIAGVGSALILVNGSTLVLSQFPTAQRTVYTALYYAGVGLGIVVSSIIVYTITQSTMAYADMWLLGGLISLPTLWIAWRFRLLSVSKQLIPEREQTQQNHVYRRFIIASYALGGFGYITAATYLPVIVSQQLPPSQQNTNIVMLLWAVVGLAAVISNPIWGKLAQRYNGNNSNSADGEVRMLLFAIIMQIISLLIPVYFSSIGMLFLAAVLFGGSFMAIVSLSMGAVKHLSSSRINFFLGLATVCYSVGQILGPLITVSIYDLTQSFHGGLLTAVGTYVISALCLLPVLYKTQR